MNLLRAARPPAGANNWKMSELDPDRYMIIAGQGCPVEYPFEQSERLPIWTRPQTPTNYPDWRKQSDWEFDMALAGVPWWAMYGG